MNLIATGWFNTNRDLVILNAVLALATLIVAFVGVRTIKSSNKVAASAERQAVASEKQTVATDSTVNASLEQLELGRDQLNQERASLQASVKPLVVDIPLGVFLEDRGTRQGVQRTIDLGSIWWVLLDSQIQISVPLRNIGAGPAFVSHAKLLANPGLVFDADVNHHVIPKNEHAMVVASILSDMPGFSALPEIVHFGLGVYYSDLSGHQRTQTVINFHFGTPRTYNSRILGFVSSVELYECDENWVRTDKPIVSTGPA